MIGVAELYGRHAGADIYVVGSGASMRVFPQSFFEGRLTIGLNMSWKVAPVTYAVTIHPDLNIPEFMPGESPRPEITWVVGRRKAENLLTAEQLQYARERFYFFEYAGRPNRQPDNEPSDAGRIIEWLERPSGNNLFVWSSIAQTGVNLAANLGARNVFVVGCDNCALAENHHAHSQHTRWKGVSPEHRYQQYYEGLADVRAAMRRRGVNVFSLTPFVTLRDPDGDFLRLCEELERPQQLDSYDISPPLPSRLEKAVHGVARTVHHIRTLLKP